MVFWVFKEGRKTPSGRIRVNESTPLDHIIAKARKIVNSPNIEILPTAKRPKETKSQFDPFNDHYHSRRLSLENPIGFVTSVGRPHMGAV